MHFRRILYKPFYEDMLTDEQAYMNAPAYVQKYTISTFQFIQRICSLTQQTTPKKQNAKWLVCASTGLVLPSWLKSVLTIMPTPFTLSSSWVARRGTFTWVLSICSVHWTNWCLHCTFTTWQLYCYFLLCSPTPEHLSALSPSTVTEAPEMTTF